MYLFQSSSKSRVWMVSRSISPTGKPEFFKCFLLRMAGGSRPKRFSVLRTLTGRILTSLMN